MMAAKKFLKSTVSAFVLLSAIASFPPAYAMQDGNDDGEEEKPSYYQRIIPAEISNLLLPLPENHPAHVIGIEYPDQDPYTLSAMVPWKLTQMILGFVDSQSLLSAQEVSTHWRSLTTEEYRRRLEHWQPGDESENLARSFVSTPRRLLSAHNVLRKKALLYPTFNSTNDNTPIVITDENLVPEVIRHVASALKETPHLQHFLCRLYLNNMDVLDTQETALASYIINKVPEMKEILQKVVTALSFEPEKFGDLARATENHHFLHRYLMALKLLRLSGDATARDLLSVLSDQVQGFIEPVPQDEITPSGDVKYAHLIGHPLWGAYIADRNSLLSQLNAIVAMSNNYRTHINPTTLRNFWEYCAVVTPEILQYINLQYLNILGKFNRVQDEGHIAEILRSLETPDLSLDSVYNYILEGRLSRSRLTLEEAKRRLNEGSVNDGLMFLKTGLGMVQYNEEVGNKIFPEAEKFLREGLNHKQEEVDDSKRHQAIHKLLEIYDEKEDRCSISNFLISLDSSDVKNLVVSREGNYSLVKCFLLSGYESLAMAILEEVRQRPEIEFNNIDKWGHIFYYQTLLKIYDDNNAPESISQLLTTADDSVLIDLAVLPKEGLPTSIFENHISIVAGHDSLAMAILGEAKRRFEHDPMILKINLEIAKRIVDSNDVGRFPEAEGYVKSALNHLYTRDWPDSEEEEPENYLDAENAEEHENLRSLFKNDFSLLSADDHRDSLDALNALRIYQGQFEEALKNLKPEFATFRAIEAQLKNPNVEVPNNILFLFGKMVFPTVFDLQEDWKETLSQNDGSGAQQFLFEIEDDHWLFNTCIERGILDSSLLQEVIEFCKTFATESTTMIFYNSGEKEEKEKEKGV